jgi:hypothetical protein
MEVGGQHHAPRRFTPQNDPVPIVQEAGGGGAGPVWTDAENPRSPDRRACSNSLYGLRYPGPYWNKYLTHPALSLSWIVRGVTTTIAHSAMSLMGEAQKPHRGGNMKSRTYTSLHGTLHSLTQSLTNKQNKKKTNT